MATTAEKTDPKLWDTVKDQVTRQGKGGKPGQWSARKAQLAVHEYKSKGGGYKGDKAADNHLSEWTREDWGTQSGKASGETGERYLPQAAREQLSPKEYQRTTAKKRADSAKGKQFSAQPADIARKTAHARDDGGSAPTRGALLKQAQQRGIKGRSRMKKAELRHALEKAG